jgi:ketosteroid isomerase-like protein
MAGESAIPDPREDVLEAMNSGDVDAILVAVATDCVWDAGSLGVFEGKQAIGAFIRDWRGAYEDFQVEFEEGEDLGNGVTYGVLLERGRPKNTSGGLVENRHSVVFRWRDGLLERYRSYNDLDKARTAAERLAQERA